MPVSMCVGAINVLVSNGDDGNKLLSCLQDERAQLNDDVSPQYIDAYLHQLTELRNRKARRSTGTSARTGTGTGT